MIDFSPEIAELEAYTRDFHIIGKRLFDLTPDTIEEQFPKQERFAIGAQIIHTRYQIACVMAQMQERLQDEADMGDEEVVELMESVYQAFHKDDDLLGPLVDEIAFYKTNNLAHSFISKYQDILLSLLQYGKSGDPKLLRKSFREIPMRDILEGGG